METILTGFAVISAAQQVARFVQRTRELVATYKNADELNEDHLCRLTEHLRVIESSARLCEGVNADERFRLELDGLCLRAHEAANKFESEMEPYRNMKKSKFLHSRFAWGGNDALIKLSDKVQEWNVYLLQYMVIFNTEQGKTILDKVTNILGILERKESIPKSASRGIRENISLLSAGDGSVQKKVLLPEAEMRDNDYERIKHTNIRCRSSAGTTHLFETRESPALPSEHCGSARDLAVALQSTKVLATVFQLSGIYPILPIPLCLGFRNSKLKFEVKGGYANPQSLRTALLSCKDGKPEHSLDQRILLMKRLASGLLYSHTIGHIHTNIRADNVLLFHNATSAASSSPPSNELGQPFLVGFDSSQMNDASSPRTIIKAIHKRYYLAPDRLRNGGVRKFSMKDDIYSLGVLFLEIALWKSFVQEPAAVLTRSPPVSLGGSRESRSNSTSPRSGGSAHATAVTLRSHPVSSRSCSGSSSNSNSPRGSAIASVSKVTSQINPWQAGSELRGRKDANGKSKLLEPEALKNKFIAMANREAGVAVGSTIASIIVACLSCTDDATVFEVPDMVQDDDNAEMGSIFMKRIIQRLERVSV